MSRWSIGALAVCAAILSFLFWTASRSEATHGDVHIVVDSLADDADETDGECTLREAITAANTNTTPASAVAGECDPGSAATVDRIDFAVPAPHTIQPTQQLPTVSQSVVIDGGTDPDVDRVELDGSAAGTGVRGLVVSAGNSTIANLVINRFTGYGIEMHTGTGNMVRGNYIGTDVTGTLDRGNGQTGIFMWSGGHTIGGAAAGHGNLVSGNDGSGVQAIFGGGNVFQGNLIGTTATGNADLSNRFTGLSVGSSNTIGGTAAGAGNVLSGNGTPSSNGEGLSVGGTNNVIQGNLVGVGADGVTPVGNSISGIVVSRENNLIGGTVAGSANTVAYNERAGILVVGNAPGNSILGNSIFQNKSAVFGVGLGIDLYTGGYGVTPNDEDDPDPGSNNLQNFPLLESAVAASTGVVEVEYALNSMPNSPFRVEFFRNGSCDTPTGHGEGEVFLGFQNVTTDADGDVTSTFTSAGSPSVAVGDVVTATATRLDSSNIAIETSEFSQCATVVPETFTVNSTNDPGTGTCDTTECTLHEAIDAANAAPGTNLIRFSIPGDGPHTIQLPGGLPGITTPMVIDATTEPDFVATPVVVLDGLSMNSIGFHISGGGTTIRGFVIGRFGSGGIQIPTGDNNTIAGNYIGVAADGVTDWGNANSGGIVTFSGSDGNTIGGPNVLDRNVISGNSGAGISIQYDSANNVIQGNYLGTNAAGTAAVPNIWGLAVQGDGNKIGGGSPGEGNVIAGNTQVGIALGKGFGGAANGNVLAGNRIGLGPSGTALPNMRGVTIDHSDTSGNVIGGTLAGEGNIIAFNTIEGIQTFATPGNAFLSNWIHSNGALGIDLGSTGPTPNDVDDPDSGANNLQNYPDVLSSVAVSGGSALIEYNFNSVPSSKFRLEFFVSDTCNAAEPNDFGEGQAFLGMTNTVTTDAGGDHSGTFIADGTPAVEVGDIITATATRLDGVSDQPVETSEFSRCAPVVAQTVSIDDVVVSEGNAGMASATFTVTRSAPAGGEISVDYQSADGTATSPSDYQAETGTLVFAADDLQKQITIDVVGDATDEPNETFSVNLRNAQNATVVDEQGIGTITDDDPAPVPPQTVACNGKAATIVGTNGNETLVGTPGVDVIAGLGGKDLIKGFGGNDIMCGGAGNDTMAGGGGNDRLVGEAGNDKLKGGSGNDRLKGGPGKDLAVGGGGKDKASRSERIKGIP